jgi:hypothetical protein
MHIEKSKIPKGLSYPLKSSVLANALNAACITVQVHLIYNSRNNFFEAFYWLPNENVDHDRFYIRTGSVASQDSMKAKDHMESIVIPEFIKWANDILSLPDNSPILQEKPYFVKLL